MFKTKELKILAWQELLLIKLHIKCNEFLGCAMERKYT